MLSTIKNHQIPTFSLDIDWPVQLKKEAKTWREFQCGKQENKRLMSFKSRMHLIGFMLFEFCEMGCLVKKKQSL